MLLYAWNPDTENKKEMSMYSTAHTGVLINKDESR